MARRLLNSIGLFQASWARQAAFLQATTGNRVPHCIISLGPVALPIPAGLKTPKATCQRFSAVWASPVFCQCFKTKRYLQFLISVSCLMQTCEAWVLHWVPERSSCTVSWRLRRLQEGRSSGMYVVLGKHWALFMGCQSLGTRASCVC